jgi:hypothetical protein
LTTTGAAAAGAYLVTITATSGSLVHTVPVNLTITVTPEFTISTTPASQSVVAGNIAGYTVTITAVNGFTDNVGFSVSGLPAGVTPGFQSGCGNRRWIHLVDAEHDGGNGSGQLSAGHYGYKRNAEPYVQHHPVGHAAA